MGTLLTRMAKVKNIALFWLARWLFNRGNNVLNHLKKAGYLPAFYYKIPDENIMDYVDDTDERYFR